METPKTFTHKSFKEAQKAAKQNKGKVFTHDAGGGWTGEHYYCTRRKRVASVCISPDGIRVV